MKGINKILILTLSFIMLSCTGDKKALKDFKIETTTDQDENKNAKVTAIFDFNNDIGFQLIELPIFNPRNNEFYGTFKMAPTIEGYDEISFTANLTQILKLRGGRADLPNGSDLPYGDIDSLEVIEIPVKGINAEIYIASKNGHILLGMAVSLKQLNGVGEYFQQPGLLFPRFKIGNITAYAGVFTGAEPGETGLGFFTVIKSTISGDAPSLIAQGLVSGSQKELLEQKMKETKETLFASEGASQKELNNFYSTFNKLRERKFRHIANPAARRRMLRKEKVILSPVINQ